LERAAEALGSKLNSGEGRKGPNAHVFLRNRVRRVNKQTTARKAQGGSKTVPETEKRKGPRQSNHQHPREIKKKSCAGTYKRGGKV